MSDEIQWYQRNLPISRIKSILGTDTVTRIVAMGRIPAVCHCQCRATGAWDANMREHHAAYLSLLEIVGA